MQGPTSPIPNAYWVQADRLLAGEYPGPRYAGESMVRLDRLCQAGVTFFLDLTQEREYGTVPYAPLLISKTHTSGQTIAYRRWSIPDFGTPKPERMAQILDTIDGAIEQGHTVYVHCYAGVGRTGTVIGCYLVRHGFSGEQALDEIVRRRLGTPTSWMRSPQTDAQCEMVRTWPAS